jgi:hypothetical protein
MMSSDQFSSLKLFTDPGQSFVPLIPGYILQGLAPFALDIYSCDKPWNFVFPGPGTDKPGIIICSLTPQLVIDMAQKDLCTAIASNPVHSMGKTHGVCTARDRYHNPISRLQ